MTNVEFCHEQSPLYSEARELYRLLKQLARAHAGWMDRDLRRHATRLLEHSAATADAASSAMRRQALRYARLSALKLCAALQAANIDEQLPDEAHGLARRQLARVFAELDVGSAVELAGAEPPTGEALAEVLPSELPEDACSVDEGNGTGIPEPELSLLATINPAGTG
jgi:hypothetical protein